MRVGGFCEDYAGYGAEDTDFAQTVAAMGGRMFWVGGADAFHQHHETHSPPVQHLHSIVHSANLFKDSWGWFPMSGWLGDFAGSGWPTTTRRPTAGWSQVDKREPTDAVIRVTSMAIFGSDLHLPEVLGLFMTPGDIITHEPWESWMRGG